MRILHTSDWHIGRTFHGVDLLADQQRVLASIAEVVAAEQVDVVVVAGDIYDRSIPSADAITVCNKGFEAIRAAGATIVATSGNHDSAARLGAAASFAAAGGLHLITRVDALDSPVLVEDEFGSVAFYGIPYLEPETTRVELEIPSARSHAEVLQAAMARIRADAQTRPDTRTVVLAHAFVSGATATGSERTIAVGGVETVPLSVFDGVDYVALGHLHSPQTFAEGVRYSGSPLPYSFGESSHRKAVWLVDVDSDGLESVRRHDLDQVRGLSTVTGTMADLLSQESFEAAESDYVSAVLTDSARPVDALRVLRQRFPHLVHVEWQRPERERDFSYRARVHGRRDIDIAHSFVKDVRDEPTEGEMHWLADALATAARAPEATAAIMRESA